METEIPILDMLTRLLVATGLALCLGLERASRQTGGSPLSYVGITGLIRFHHCWLECFVWQR
ncbi:hypothetical protein HSBAA_25990 [Vreelandella sulfidaeris]|uniref:Protein MgtC n=1 Tax=Vreelandella sulfidaeris TaxID=115553 RepID=A0A455U7X0_9GAMM|nr:hypothetical protein HSBAA_25990 [Halomonas sulfidaeris]